MRSKLPVMQTVAGSWRPLIAQWRFSLLLGLSLAYKRLDAAKAATIGDVISGWTMR